MKDATLELFHVSDSVEDALEYIESYKETVTSVKWMTTEEDMIETVAEE